MSDQLRDAAKRIFDEPSLHHAAKALEASQAEGHNTFWQAKAVVEAYAQWVTGVDRISNWKLKCPHCDYLAEGFEPPRGEGENPHLMLNKHMAETHADRGFKCGRRQEIGAMGDDHPFRLPKMDYWYERDGRQTCSYCGSAHPDAVFKAIEAGDQLIPTDKSYKVYVGSAHAKFYFQHFDEAQQRQFIDLLNAGSIKLAVPGHFYALPFFIKREPVENA